MYQIIQKRWGLSPQGLPVRLAVLSADEPDEELPEDLPVGSCCLCADGTRKVFFGQETGWVVLQESAQGRESASGASSSGLSEAQIRSLAQDSARETLIAGGSFPKLTAGNALSLYGTQSRKRIFSFERAGADGTVGTGPARIRKIYGNTIRYRQSLNLTLTDCTESGVTFTRNPDRSVTVQTDSQGALADVEKQIGTYAWVNGHKHLLCGCPPGGGTDGYRLGGDTGSGWVQTATTTGNRGAYVNIRAGTVLTQPVTFYPQAFDLTEIFGQNNEPGKEDFETYFPKGVYPYDTGDKWLHFKGRTLKSTGFNAWNGTCARVLRGADGQGGSHGYEITGCSGSVWFSRTLEGDRHELTVQTYTTETGATVRRVLPPGSGYLFLQDPEPDACVHLVQSGIRSGEREDYVSDELALPVLTYFPSGMRSVGGVRDELTESYAVKRVESVDLGSISWTKSSDTAFFTDYFKNASSRAVRVPSSGHAANMVTSFAPVVASTANKGFSLASSGSALGRLWFICEGGYDDAEALRSALSGYLLLYELANPVTTVFEEKKDFSFLAGDSGSEEILSSDPSSYAILDAEYGINAQETLRSLPSGYVSRESFEAFCDELEEKTGVSVGMTYEEGAYVFTIDAGSRILPAVGASDAGKIVKVNAAGNGYVLESEGG